MAVSINNVHNLSSPVRRISLLKFQPYGGTTSVNVLPHFLGTPDVVTNVLFLGSGDLRNALVTAAKMSDAYPMLNLHMNDDCNLTTARNILITHIILSDNFNPSKDMDYIWDLWYSLQWNNFTRQRFARDVKTLMDIQWEKITHIVLDANDVKEFKGILATWLKYAFNFTETVDRFCKHRLSSIVKEEYMENCLHSFLTSTNGNERIGLNISDRIRIMSSSIRQRLRINLNVLSPELSCSENGEKEIENFLYTGNVGPVHGQIVCVNPSFVTRVPNEPEWEANYSCSPFDAYFPITLDEQLTMEQQNPDSTAISNSPISTAKPNSNLSLWNCDPTSTESHFIFTLKQIQSIFAFVIKSCKTSFKLFTARIWAMWSDLTFVFVKANLLPAATSCLLQNDFTAVLLTETSRWVNFQKSTVAEYVELVLACPLSMIPTVYGLRLANHLLLGSSDCANLHDLTSSNLVTLKWLKTASTYSNNIKLAVSPALKSTIDRITSFIMWRRVMEVNTEDIEQYTGEIAKMWLPYTPLTVMYVLQSLARRCQWVQGAFEFLLETEAIPAPLRLVWRTQHAWLSGEPVLLLSTKSRDFVQYVQNDDDSKNSSLILVTEDIEIKPEHRKSSVENFIGNVFLAKSHCIDYLGWDKNTKRFLQVSPKELIDSSDHSCSFLLTRDHGCGPDTLLCVFTNHLKKLVPFSLFDNFKSSIVVNTSPSLLAHRPSAVHLVPELALYVINCIESADDYQLEIGVRSNQSITDISELVVEVTNGQPQAQHPLFSAHEITLTLGSSTPLVLQFPWPFLVNKIKSLLCKKKKKKKRIQLVLTKSINDAWPVEFGGRSKFDPDLLKHWKDLTSNGHLKMHLDPQYSCDILHSKGPPSSTLTRVRHMVQTLFLSHLEHPFSFLFAIHDCNAAEPVFHLRIQPPVRFTPQGSPLLLVSIIDHQLAEQLIVDGKLDRETLQSDFHRIITQGVSREVCVIRTSLAEEVDLFRYSLRLNATKMRRGAWQSKNLPRGDNSPWLPTFISPLYAENINTKWNCKMVLNPTNIKVPTPLDECSFCHIKTSTTLNEIHLKQCGKCMSVSYCSVACQKRHWSVHKTVCHPL